MLHTRHTLTTGTIGNSTINVYVNGEPCAIDFTFVDSSGQWYRIIGSGSKYEIDRPTSMTLGALDASKES